MSDYSISWGYIVSRMESLYGIKPDSEEKVAYGDIERHMNYIWQEYFEILYKEEFGTKMEEQIKNKARPTFGELAEIVVNDVLEEQE